MRLAAPTRGSIASSIAAAPNMETSAVAMIGTCFSKKSTNSRASTTRAAEVEVAWPRRRCACTTFTARSA
ncbi:hypothetical protein D3C81_1506520 [compost metagenome]